MPVKGWKKGYVKDPDGKWVDPRTLKKEEKPKPKKPKVVTKATKVPTKEDLGPTTKSVPDDREYAKVIICWKDARKRDRSTQYVMANLSISENVSEEFIGAKKKTRINLSLDGTVLEKL